MFGDDIVLTGADGFVGLQERLFQALHHSSILNKIIELGDADDEGNNSDEVDYGLREGKSGKVEDKTKQERNRKSNALASHKVQKCMKRILECFVLTLNSILHVHYDIYGYVSR